jgi:hypothetical protein
MALPRRLHRKPWANRGIWPAGGTAEHEKARYDNGFEPQRFSERQIGAWVGGGTGVEVLNAPGGLTTARLGKTF